MLRALQLFDLAIEVVDILHRAVDLAREVLPFVDPERNSPNRLGSLHLGPVQTGAQTLARLLIGNGGGLHLFLELLQLFVQRSDFQELAGGIGTHFQIGRSALFNVSQVYHRLQFEGSPS